MPINRHGNQSADYKALCNTAYLALAFGDANGEHHRLSTCSFPVDIQELYSDESADFVVNRDFESTLGVCKLALSKARYAVEYRNKNGEREQASRGFRPFKDMWKKAFNNRQGLTPVYFLISFDRALLEALVTDPESAVQHCPFAEFSVPYVPISIRPGHSLALTRRPCDPCPEELVDSITLPFRLSKVKHTKPLPANLPSGR